MRTPQPSMLRSTVLVLAWLAGRAVLVWLLLGPQQWVTGDVSYFDLSLTALPGSGLAATLPEYPLPAVAVVAVPWLVAGVLGVSYGVVLVGVAALTDLAFTLLLARHDPSRWATAAWVLAVPALGATAYARFDLLPGVLCGAAVLLLARHPRLAAACAALATAVKLWPALVLPGLLAAARPRRPAVLVVALTGVAAAGSTLLLTGWDRLLSPLTYQADRGLQVESVLATPAVLGWALGPGRWAIGYAPSKSYEITGPGVDALLLASTVATVGYVVALGLAWAWLWRARDGVSRETALWLTLASVTGFVVVGKVLSPQYLLWLLPMTVAGVAVAGSAPLRRWTAGLLVAAVLTQVVFPASYAGLSQRTDEMWVAVLALTARNVLMLLLLVAAVTGTWAAARSDRQRGIELERQPPGPDGYDARTSR